MDKAGGSLASCFTSDHRFCSKKPKDPRESVLFNMLWNVNKKAKGARMFSMLVVDQFGQSILYNLANSTFDHLVGIEAYF